MIAAAISTGRRASALAAALLGVVPFAGPTNAQPRPVEDPVNDVNARSRPEYDAVGVRLGGFTLYPQVAVNLAFDNNIYRTDSPRRSDMFAAIMPRMRLESSSTLYPLALEASATVRRYARNETEDSSQYRLAATGGAELPGGIRIAASASQARALEPRGQSGDLFVGGKPIAYRLTQAAATVSRAMGRASIAVGGNLARYHYADARIGGGRIDQSFRDYRVSGGNIRLAYALSPAIALFVNGAIDRSVYPASRAIDRSSTDLSVLAGIDLGITSLVSGSAAIGYVREKYDGAGFADQSGLDYELALKWTPTPLVTLALSGSRSQERSPFIGSAGGVERSIRIGVDYELLRQLILSADAGHDRETFRGLERRDRRIEGRIGARYLVSRVVAFTATVDYRRQRSSGLAARDFDGFGAAIGVTLHR